MSFQDTLADLIKGDNEALLKLIREVYLRGVDDGAEAARSEDFDCIFHNWDEVEAALDAPSASIEDFVGTVLSTEYI